jgi:hypothetical protein
MTYQLSWGPTQSQSVVGAETARQAFAIVRGHNLLDRADITIIACDGRLISIAELRELAATTGEDRKS